MTNNVENYDEWDNYEIDNFIINFRNENFSKINDPHTIDPNRGNIYSAADNYYAMCTFGTTDWADKYKARFYKLYAKTPTQKTLTNKN